MAKTATETYENMSTEQLVAALAYVRNSRRRDMIVEQLTARHARHHRFVLVALDGGLYGVRDKDTAGQLLAVRGETALEWGDAWDLFQEFRAS